MGTLRAFAHKYHWTEEDNQYLRQFAHRYTMERILKHFENKRSEISIWRQCQRLGLSRARKNDGYTLEKLIEGLCIGKRKIYKWVDCGWLKSSRQGPDAAAWNFKDVDIAAFLRQHPEQVSAEVLKSLWVQDLLFDGWEHGMGPLCDMREMA